MKRGMESRLATVLLAILPLLFTLACGGFSSVYDKNPNVSFERSSSPFGGESIGPLSNSEYNCGINANVRPPVDPFNDGTGLYTTCCHQTDPLKMKIHGRSRGSSTVWVYPIEIAPDGVFSLQDPDAPGSIYSRPIQTSEDGAEIDFDVPYDAVYIVEEQFKFQMDICIASNDRALCPVFSAGETGCSLR